MHHDHSHGGASHDHSPHPAHDDATDAALAELLDLDGVVLRSYWADLLTDIERAATRAERVADLGAGSGVGTIALAQHFAGAEVVAIDSAPEMLRRIGVKAVDLGLAHRIRTVAADLDVEWPAVGHLDITLASMSMHHLADPDRVLGDLLAATRPGGLLAVAELTEPLRFLPDELGFGRPGLEARCLDALAGEHADTLPLLGSNWAPRLVAAGFTVLSERTIAIALDPPHPPATTRYADLWLRRMRSGLANRLAPDDLAALDTLIDGTGPASLQQRDDIRVRGSRTLTLARRP